MKNSYFYDNYAISTGVLRVINKATIVLENCTFAYNSALNDHSIATLIDIDTKSTIKNCRFEKNYFASDTAGLDLILIMEVDALSISNCEFVDNTATYQTPNIKIVKSTGISISNSTFINNRKPKNSQSYTGNFLYIIAGSAVTISKSTFTNGFGFEGGAIYLLGDCSLTVTSSVFENNYSYGRGGAISAL